MTRRRSTQALLLDWKRNREPGNCVDIPCSKQPQTPPCRTSSAIACSRVAEGKKPCCLWTFAHGGTQRRQSFRHNHHKNIHCCSRACARGVAFCFERNFWPCSVLCLSSFCYAISFGVPSVSHATALREKRSSLTSVSIEEMTLSVGEDAVCLLCLHITARMGCGREAH